MVNSKQLNGEGKIEESDLQNQGVNGDFEDSLMEEDGRSGGVTDRLREIVRNGGDEDLLLQQNDRENNVLQWLQALDLQVIGACRADERLKPLLKMNVSNGAAEDCLLSHLIQHFEASEVGMLARCFFMPLVSIRVGKIIKQGTLLCPAADRGNLNLILLPSSDVRISFVGDDGCTERLATLSNNYENSIVGIEEISADTSGRSFALKLPSSRAYFWCSEKSMILGTELLSKMKDLLRRRPSLSELTGISESRLECFAIHLHAYLLGSTVSNTDSNSTVPSLVSASEPAELDSVATNAQSLSVTDNLLQFPSKSLIDVATTQKEPPEINLPHLPSSLSFLESLGELTAVPSSTRLSLELPSSQDPTPGSFNLSPYYCWCPPGTSTLPNLTISSAESISLPPLPPLASFDRSPIPSVLWKDLSEVSSLDFLPAFLPEVPLPISFATMPGSQQIPTFTPLMSDPIVHIPAISICSSGQGYLVGGGSHAIPTTIPPLLPHHIVNPTMTDTESMVEQGARETLRFLLSSAQANPWSMEAFSAPLSGSYDPHITLFSASRGVYSGTTDLDAASVNGIEDAVADTTKRHGGGDLIDSDNQMEGFGGCSDNNVG